MAPSSKDAAAGIRLTLPTCLRESRAALRGRRLRYRHDASIGRAWPTDRLIATVPCPACYPDAATPDPTIAD